jgi:hypothetical protein
MRMAPRWIKDQAYKTSISRDGFGERGNGQVSSMSVQMA